MSGSSKVLAASFGMLLVVGAGQSVLAQNENLRELVSACVTARKAEYVAANITSARQAGGVTCPAGDIVGFPPRARRHDRSGEIKLAVPRDHEFCANPNFRLVEVSDNGGSSGNLQISEDRRSASLPISCSGASIGNGRRWFNATMVLDICPVVGDGEIFDFTLACMELLRD